MFCELSAGGANPKLINILAAQGCENLLKPGPARPVANLQSPASVRWQRTEGKLGFKLSKTGQFGLLFASI